MRRIAIVGSRPPELPRGPDDHVRLQTHRTFAGLVERCRQYVETLERTDIVISGGAPGIDTVAEQAARARGMTVRVYPADWRTHGKRAGFIRNGEMVRAADAITAFWDGVSRGTRDTIGQALDSEKPCIVYTHEGVHPLTRSTMRLFPDHWANPNAHLPVVRTPVGSMCASCDRAIHAGDAGLWVVNAGEPSGPGWLPWHRECWLHNLGVNPGPPLN